MTGLVRRAMALVAVILALPLLLAPQASAYVYWAQANPDGSANEVARANLDGSEAGRTLVSNPSVTRGIAVDSTHLYWVGGGAIGRVELDGSNQHPHFVTDLSDVTTWVAVDADHLYWNDRVPSSTPVWEWGTIGRANLDGSGVDRTFITGLPPYSVNGPAVDAAHIYWADWSNDRIGRANLDGSGVQTDFIHASGSGGVAVDAAHIYWANGTESNSIGRANLDGTAVDPSFIPLSTYPLSIAVDADHVYWTRYECVGNCDFFRGRIGRADLDGTDVADRFISTGTATPFGLALDALGPPGSTTAKHNQRQRGHRIRVTVEIEAGKDLDYRARGSIRLKRAYRLKPRAGTLDAGESETLRLRPKRTAANKVAGALKRGKKAKAEVSVRLADAAGDSDTEKLRVRLKR
jgi:Low-density lipoprotein receptor repeat class B